MKEVSLSLLFEEKRYPQRDDRNWDQEEISTRLESVADRRKAMEVLSITTDMIGSDLYLELLNRSSELNVLAAFQRSAAALTPDQGYLFFVSKEELWRIPAYQALKRAFRDCDWSDGAEFLEGSLLGYSEAQMTAWIDAKRRARLGWSGLTCYLLMSVAQRSAVGRLANRCIDPLSVKEDIKIFYNTNNPPLKTNAKEFLPGETHLCRASIGFSFFKKLFARDIGSGQHVPFFVSAINPENAHEFNEALLSSLQFWGD